MVEVLRYDNPGAVRPVRLIPRAAEGTPESRVVLHVGRLEPAVYKDASYENDAILAENRRQLRELQRQYPRDVECPRCEGAKLEDVEEEGGARAPCKRCEGLGLVSDWPDLYRPGHVVQALVARWEALQRRVIALGARRLEGVEIAGTEARELEEGASIARVVEYLGIMPLAYAAIMVRQAPEKQEAFSSGS